MSEYDWSYLEVCMLGLGTDDEVESPEWTDVEHALKQLAEDEIDGSVTLALEEDDDSDTAPTMFASLVGEEMDVTVRYDDSQLAPGEERYSLDDTLRMFKLFYDEQRLDPADDWQPL